MAEKKPLVLGDDGLWEVLQPSDSLTPTETRLSVNQASHGFSVGNILRHDGSDYQLAQANTSENAEVIGIVSEVLDANSFKIQFIGIVNYLTGITPGKSYFLSPTVAGNLTDVEPTTTGQISKPLLTAVSTTGGFFFNYRGIRIP